MREITMGDVIREIAKWSFIWVMANSSFDSMHSDKSARSALGFLGLGLSVILVYANTNQLLGGERLVEPEAGVHRRMHGSLRLVQEIARYGMVASTVGLAGLITYQGSSRSLTQEERNLVIVNLAASKIILDLDTDRMFDTGELEERQANHTHGHRA